MAGTAFSSDGNCRRTCGSPVASGVLAIRRDANPFVRGDSNSDGLVDIGDAISILNLLFLDGTGVHCANAANAEATNGLNISDAIRILGFLFLGNALQSKFSVTAWLILSKSK